ncbi:hypothetical protein N3K66_001794 [Trichothecium roseum]|uniref:Uncharacterized protein n=1 Tax=Trichothecium roseum TaxID=47278 RepID=A0ACC0V7R1_9HYPO|nr:hypothetical protein N3K66_001794 [Trichothecium roseum]
MASRPTTTTRHSPFLPTPLERIGLIVFPLVLVFGTIYSQVSPLTRATPYDPVAQAHSQDPSLAPSYFARKSNLFNILFVKRGWAWVTASIALWIVTHPAVSTVDRKVKAVLRWFAITACWVLVTQWCFGAPLIDRGFRWTGGKCDFAELEVETGVADVKEMVTAVACKTAGGKWKGGHDISGHVFLLVLGTGFLMQELGWPVLRWRDFSPDERSVVMSDGALKSASVEIRDGADKGKRWDGLGPGGKFVVVVMGLNLWMLLMTAMYFHTWFEKLTGLLTAAVSLYIVYIIPRFVPVLRGIFGMPGI